jgi:hypothetical protein
LNEVRERCGEGEDPAADSVAEFTPPLLAPAGAIILKTHFIPLMRFGLSGVRPLEVLFHA